MAGIYIHIPFCRKRCFYCDFYKTTAISKKTAFSEALFREINLFANYLNGEAVETIYFGGGTPSTFTCGEIEAILFQLKETFTIEPNVEITLEANPDDLHPQYLINILKTGVNRLSIGIQSFSDQDLVKMNRRHTSAQAIQSVHDAANTGFSGISIDLIYGLPGLTRQQWKENLKIASSLPGNHISAYHLTYHKNTIFHKWLKNGLLTEIPEDESILQYEELIRHTKMTGFEQYEISNFARNNAYSRHNSNYWLGRSYLGLGPSAHSYNGISRHWNTANINHYISCICSGMPAYKSEILSSTDKLNEYMITRLRTRWGISLEHIRSVYGEDNKDKVIRSAGRYLDDGSLKRVGDEIFLTHTGVMISDQIMLSLLVE